MSDRQPNFCPHCGTATVAGAGFCAKCGLSLRGDAPVRSIGGTSSAHSPTWWTPWRIAAALSLLAIGAIGWAMSRGPGSAPDGTVAQAPGAPPDISNLSPSEQFIRLSDRVETSMEAGDTATVVRFFPMVSGAFANLSSAERDIDARFHMSLLLAQVGHFPAAVAQVDSIEAIVPTHLFADYLRAMIADYQGDTTAARKARVAFRKHYASEIAAKRPEYDAHQKLLDAFLKTTPEK